MDILHCTCSLEHKFKADLDLAVGTGGRTPQSFLGSGSLAINPVWIKGTPFTRAPEVCVCVCVVPVVCKQASVQCFKTGNST